MMQSAPSNKAHGTLEDSARHVAHAHIEAAGGCLVCGARATLHFNVLSGTRENPGLVAFNVCNDCVDLPLREILHRLGGLVQDTPTSWGPMLS